MTGHAFCVGRLLAGREAGRSCAVCALMTERVGYGDCGDATCKAAQPPRFAMVPSAPGFGFPMWRNNARECHVARDIAREPRGRHAAADAL